MGHGYDTDTNMTTCPFLKNVGHGQIGDVFFLLRKCVDIPADLLLQNR